MAHTFDTVAFIGLGLIGGSVAAGIRERKLARKLVAYDPNAVNLKQALDSGLIDDTAISARGATEGADLVVLAAPVMALGPVLGELKAVLQRDDVVITDVGSVKQPVIEFARAACGEFPSSFVPGHPIAGSERHGVDAADANLFANHRVILTPPPGTRADARDKVRALWSALGAEVIEMEAAHHDSVLAQTSHLPHLLAYALVDTLSSGGDSTEVFEFAAGGFRDFSRIAASDPIMWRDIFQSNASEILPVLDEFRHRLDEMRALIRDGKTQELSNILARSKAARDHFSQLLEARERSRNES